MKEMSDEALRDATRLCFFAHYHPHGIAAEHVLIYLRALRDAGFTVVILSTAAMPEAEQAKLRAECARLILRENVGLDFGGWIEAVRRFFPIRAELLLLANDSVYAPIGDLSGFIDRLTGVPADFYGAVETFEVERHMQSWFLLFRPSAYQSTAFRTLLAQPIPAGMSKRDIIRTYEVGITARLTEAGLRHHAAYSQERYGLLVKRAPLNVAHILWRELIERTRLPFLKIELLRDNPAGIRNLGRWKRVVGRYDPMLRDAITADLLQRSTPRTAARIGEWIATLEEERSFMWPEFHGFVRRDLHTGRPGARQRLNGIAFAAARPIVKLARYVAIRIRWRLSDAR